jgi:hypothetical protein
VDVTARTTIVGIFDEIMDAESAISALHSAGFTDEQIGYIRRNGDAAAGTTPIVEEHHTGVGAGALIGGLIGAAAALLIPGIGPVIAGGVLVNTVGATAAGAAAVGAVGGAVAGGVIGALSSMGVPEDEARYADEQFQAGCTIVTVTAAGRTGEATDILHRYGAYDVHSERSGPPPTAPPAPMAATSGGATEERIVTLT